MARVIRRYELTDAERERPQPYFPERQTGDKGRPKREPREILNGILHRPKRSGVAGPAEAVRPVANGVQAVQVVVGKQPDREDLP